MFEIIEDILSYILKLQALYKPSSDSLKHIKQFKSCKNSIGLTLELMVCINNVVFYL